MAGDDVQRPRRVGHRVPANGRGSAAAVHASERPGWAILRLSPLLVGFLVTWALSDNGGRSIDDEGPFLAAARRLLDGHYALAGTMDGTKFLWHGPGLPALIAPLVALGAPLTLIRLLGPLLLFAAVVVFYRLLALRLSRRTALIGAYALGLYAPMYEGIDGSLQKEPLALLTSVIALYGTARYVTEGRRRDLALAGLALGGLAMTRLEYGWAIGALLAIGVVWWVLARVRHGAGSPRVRVARRSTLVSAAGMLTCVPWLVYTYALTHQLFYWGNSGGISLYWMSSPASSQLGQWHASHTVFANPQLAAYRPLFRHLSALSPVRRDLALRHLALVQAEGHPAKYALNLLANVSRMLFGFPFSFTLSPAVIVGLVIFNLALVGGLIAAAVSLRSNRRSLPPEATPFLWFAAIGFAVHLFPSAEPRFLIPLVPVAVWVMAHALHRDLTRRRPDSWSRALAGSPAPSYGELRDRRGGVADDRVGEAVR